MSEGWFDDPTAQRWWDGRQWTTLTREAGAPAEPGPVADGLTEQVAGWYQDPLRQRWWNGTVWTETVRYQTPVHREASSHGNATTPPVHTSSIAGPPEPQQGPVGDASHLAPTDAPSIPLWQPPRSPAVTKTASDQSAAQQASQTEAQKSGRRTRPAIVVGAAIGVAVLLIGTLALTRSDDTDSLASPTTEPDVTANPTPTPTQPSESPPPPTVPPTTLPTTGAATQTTENDPGLFAYVSFLEMMPEHRTPPFRSGDQTFGILQLPGMDWSPFDPPGAGTWYLVRFFNHGEGSIEPVARFETPNDANVENVSVEVIGADSMRFPFVVFRWCCPMGHPYRSDSMVTVVQVIDSTLVEVTAGAPLGPMSPTYWSNDLSPDRLELDINGEVTTVTVGEGGKASEPAEFCC